MSTSSTTSDDDHIAPVLGSAYLTSQSLIPPALPTDQFSPSLCLNISLFKSTLKKYRGLDDQIMVRLNRDAALHRGDAMATGELGSAERKTCLRIWREMTESWKRREAVIRYCVKSTDDRLESREVELQRSNVSTRYSAEKLDANRSDRIREDLFSEQVKRQQLHNELSVESIIRRRTLAAFFSRCPSFQPPPDPEGGPAVPLVDLQSMPMRSRPINN